VAFPKNLAASLDTDAGYSQLHARVPVSVESVAPPFVETAVLASHMRLAAALLTYAAFAALPAHAVRVRGLREKQSRRDRGCCGGDSSKSSHLVFL